MIHEPGGEKREDAGIPRAHGADDFGKTRWSLVMAVKGGGTAAVERSLDDLCQDYWYPVYAYIRRCGHGPEPAFERARAFFASLPDQIRRLDPAAHGQFRRFLLAQLHRFLAEHEDVVRDPAIATIVPPITLTELEARQRRDHSPEAAPDQVFQRGFALEVLARSLHRLGLEAEEGGRAPMFKALERYLIADPAPGQHESLAQQLGVSPLALVLAIKRLRQRFRELVDAELGDTVVSASDLETERATLLAILAASR